jgi:hypothetical protein
MIRFFVSGICSAIKGDIFDLRETLSSRTMLVIEFDLLEAAGSNSHDDKTDKETPERGRRVVEHGRKGRGKHDYVANDCNENSSENGVKPSEVLVGNISTKNRHKICPERVDCINSAWKA